MAGSTDIVKLHLGSTELDDPDVQTFIEKAERFYDTKLSGEHVDQARYDDVVEYLAAHLIASGPERQISSAGEGGGNVSFEGEYEKTSHWDNAVEADPTGQLDEANGHFTLST